METWTEADWDSWDKDNHAHMKLFFTRIRLQYTMRKDADTLRKVFAPCPEPILLKEEQDAPTWMLTLMVVALLTFTVFGLYLVK